MIEHTPAKTVILSKQVSVIIPAYNSSAWIRRALDSLLAQTQRPLEIIVVDDGSTDGTLAMLQEAYGIYPDIRILRQENQGCAAARNRGAVEAKGEYLAFLDADDVWSPWKLEAQLTALRDYPNWGLSGTNGRNFYVGEEPSGLATSAEVGEINLLSQVSLFRCNWIWTSSTLVKRSVFDECGGFDPAVIRCQDHDLWLKIAWKYAVVQLSAIHVGYQITPGSLTRDRWAAALEGMAVVARWLDVHPETVMGILRQRAMSYTRKALRDGNIEQASAMFFNNVYGKKDSWPTRVGFRCLKFICRLHRAFGKTGEF